MRTYKKVIAIVLCAAFIGLVAPTGMVWAQEKKASMQGEMQQEITGTVEKTDKDGRRPSKSMGVVATEKV